MHSVSPAVPELTNLIAKVATCGAFKVTSETDEIMRRWYTAVGVLDVSVTRVGGS